MIHMRQTFDNLSLSVRLADLERVLSNVRTSNSLNSTVESLLNSLRFIKYIALKHSTSLDVYIDNCLSIIEPAVQQLSNIDEISDNPESYSSISSEDVMQLEKELKDINSKVLKSQSNGYKMLTHIEKLANLLTSIYEPKVQEYIRDSIVSNNNPEVNNNKEQAFINSLFNESTQDNSFNDGYKSVSNRPKDEASLWNELTGINDFRKKMNIMFLGAILKELEALYAVPPPIAYGVLYNYCMNEALIKATDNPFINIVSMNELLETREKDIHSTARVIASAFIVNKAGIN